MLAEREKMIISKCTEKYNVSSVILLGSSAEQVEFADDIDIAVNGIDKNLWLI